MVAEAAHEAFQVVSMLVLALPADMPPLVSRDERGTLVLLGAKLRWRDALRGVKALLTKEEWSYCKRHGTPEPEQVDTDESLVDPALVPAPLRHPLQSGHTIASLFVDARAASQFHVEQIALAIQYGSLATAVIKFPSRRSRLEVLVPEVTYVGGKVRLVLEG